MLKSICRAAGCSKTADYPSHYCKEHSYMEADKKDFNTAMSNFSTGYSNIYNSPRWRKESKEFLRKNPLCNCCGDKAEVVDHVVPHKGNEELFWDKNNWQSLCKRCHDKKTHNEIIQRQKDRARDRELERRYGTTWKA